MATGRKYIVRYTHRKRVNRFTADTYDAVCSDIEWANIDANKKNVIVKHAKGKQAGVMTLIKSVLSQNHISINSYQKYASTNVKTLVKFSSQSDASKARDIINAMVDDRVNTSAVTPTGETTTANGVKIKVDTTRDANGNAVLSEGTTYIPSTSSTGGSSTGDDKNDYTRWFLIGGAVLVGVIVLLAVLKKYKKI